MERFGDVIDPQNPYYRTVLKHRCVTLRGIIRKGPYFMPDGDVKWEIEVEPATFMLGYYDRQDVLRPENDGLLPIELVCGATVTDLKCNNCKLACGNGYKARYSAQTIRQYFTNGKWIDVTGELITDTGPAGKPPRPAHGGTEIHPVTSITLTNAR
jgi:hypothetical protein